MPAATGEIVYTVGHSNRSLDELRDLLTARSISTLVDIRRTPWSRRHPQFCRPSLERYFHGQEICYVHIEALGGRREALTDSPNAGLSAAVRGYADHMASSEFRAALDQLETLAPPLALMCAEADPADCHRSILSDEMVRRGVKVVHLLGAGRQTTHAIDPRAVDEGSRLIYPSSDGTQLQLPLDDPGVAGGGRQGVD